jgi:hypothetical protein
MLISRMCEWASIRLQRQRRDEKVAVWARLLGKESFDGERMETG